MSDPDQIWDGFLNHPGWHAFRAFVEQEWGPSGMQYQAALDKALNDRNIDHACQIRSGQKVIAALMRWPLEQAAKARKGAVDHEEPVTMSRRGGL